MTPRRFEGVETYLRACLFRSHGDEETASATRSAQSITPLWEQLLFRFEAHASDSPDGQSILAQERQIAAVLLREYPQPAGMDTNLRVRPRLYLGSSQANAPKPFLMPMSFWVSMSVVI